MLVKLFDPEIRGIEITPTIDISSHGARVVSKNFWQTNENISVHSMDGSTYSSARVVHCQFLKDHSYAVGLELADPSPEWLEFNEQLLHPPKR
jgi:PilZ domain